LYRYPGGYFDFVLRKAEGDRKRGKLRRDGNRANEIRLNSSTGNAYLVAINVDRKVGLPGLVFDSRMLSTQPRKQSIVARRVCVCPANSLSIDQTSPRRTDSKSSPKGL
jgi:hypothetical protein